MKQSVMKVLQSCLRGTDFKLSGKPGKYELSNVHTGEIVFGALDLIAVEQQINLMLKLLGDKHKKP